MEEWGDSIQRVWIKGKDHVLADPISRNPADRDHCQNLKVPGGPVKRIIRQMFQKPIELDEEVAFLEAFVGIGMIAGLPAYIIAPISLFIGGVGAVSVIKAVYIDKRELKCACVGGDSNVPLGFISLTENLFMIAAGIWMFVK